MNEYVADYAGRILAGILHDGWGPRVTGPQAQYLSGRYGVDITWSPGVVSSSEVAKRIATQILGD